MRSYLYRACLVLGILALASALLSAGPSGYHVTKKIVLGGEGGWQWIANTADCFRSVLINSWSW
jgi:hypothetical protein